jgi:hypothetical protein
MASAPAPPSPPPRPVTRAASRRSWLEPRVRFWWLATIVLLVIALWFVAEQILAFRGERQLIRHGALVAATVSSVDGDSRVGKQVPPGTPCELKFPWNGQILYVTGTLAGDDYVTDGETVQLHVDPRDPSDWTDRNEAEPVGRRMIAGAVVVLAVIATSAASLRLRRRMLRAWADAPAVPYSVFDTRHAALAPLSHAVRCVAVSGRDQNLVTVYLPARLPRPETGDVLWLIHPPGNPSAAVAAAAFQ